MALLPRDRRLVIAGGETLFDYRAYRAEWAARALDLGLDPVVLGPVPHDELPRLMAGADVFAFPSTKEGFGLAAMEALAAGIPVVARDLPVLREVFAGAVRFFTTVPELAAALAEPDRSRREAGRALAARHTWAAAAQHHLAWYASLPVARRAGPAERPSHRDAVDARQLDGGAGGGVGAARAPFPAPRSER
jgi:glycosyltransferase involved in cell wall biosynthesis